MAALTLTETDTCPHRCSLTPFIRGNTMNFKLVHRFLSTANLLYLHTNIMPVNVVLGAGGPTGFQCVKRLLEVTDLPVRAVVRDPAKYKERFEEAAGPSSSSSRLQVVAGDVTSPSGLTEALRDASGVIFAASGSGYWTAKAVDEQGVGNVVEAAKSAGSVRHVVLVSSMLTHPSNRFNPIRIILNNIRWSLMDHKFAGEELLRHSGLQYTVVRPAGLTTKPAGQMKLQADVDATKEKQPGGSISRADVAAICVEALHLPSAANKTFSVSCAKGQQPLADGETVTTEVQRLLAAPIT